MLAPERVRTLDDLAPVIELYHHTVRAGQYDAAFTLFRDRIHNAAYYQFGAYQLIVVLLTDLFPGGGPLTSLRAGGAAAAEGRERPSLDPERAGQQLWSEWPAPGRTLV